MFSRKQSNSMKFANEKTNGLPIEKGFDHPKELKEYLLEEILSFNYYKTKKELKGVFTVDEIILIISVFSSHYYSPNFAGKDELITELEKATSSRASVKNDNEVLMTKINKLTEFQAFTLIRMVLEFWSCMTADYNSYRYIDLKIIFEID